MTLAAACLKAKDEGVTLAVRVQPGARKSEVTGMVGSELKVKIASPPVDGAANEELIKFIAAMFSVRASRLAIIQGERGRSKVLKIEGIDLEMAQASLGRHLL